MEGSSKYPVKIDGFPTFPACSMPWLAPPWKLTNSKWSLFRGHLNFFGGKWLVTMVILSSLSRVTLVITGLVSPIANHLLSGDPSSKGPLRKKTWFSCPIDLCIQISIYAQRESFRTKTFIKKRTPKKKKMIDFKNPMMKPSKPPETERSTCLVFFSLSHFWQSFEKFSTPFEIGDH